MPAARPDITLIAAVARNGVIGSDGGLLVRLPQDMRFFTETTRGHTVIMGMQHWRWLPAKPGCSSSVVHRSMRKPSPWRTNCC
jgi:dihydrofolate reductase